MGDWEKSVNSARSASISWWVLAVRGILVLILGLLILMEPWWPRVGDQIKTYLILILIFSGSFQMYLSWATRRELRGWLWPFALGIVELILASYLLFSQDITASILPYYIGFWLLFRSLFMIYFAIEVKNLGGWNTGYMTAGVLLCLSSLFIIFNPFIESLAIAISTMIALSISGISQIYFSFMVRKTIEQNQRAQQKAT